MVAQGLVPEAPGHVRTQCWHIQYLYQIWLISLLLNKVQDYGCTCPGALDYGCTCPGALRHQGMCNHNSDLVTPLVALSLKIIILIMMALVSPEVSKVVYVAPSYNPGKTLWQSWTLFNTFNEHLWQPSPSLMILRLSPLWPLHYSCCMIIWILYVQHKEIRKVKLGSLTSMI